jgi:hypothetical protein
MFSGGFESYLRSQFFSWAKLRPSISFDDDLGDPEIVSKTFIASSFASLPLCLFGGSHARSQ